MQGRLLSSMEQIKGPAFQQRQKLTQEIELKARLTRRMSEIEHLETACAYLHLTNNRSLEISGYRLQKDAI